MPEVAYFTRRWGEVDGAAAMAFAEKMWPGKSNMGEVVTHMAGGWASQQPQQAVDWINAHPNAESWMQDCVMVGLVDGLAEKDIELARRFVEDRLDDPHSEKYLAQLTDKYVYSFGMDKAEAWFDSLSYEKLGLAKTRMMVQLADRHLRAGPEQAAAFLSRYVEQPWFGQVAAIQVAREYYRTDPVKAEAWVNTMPETMRNALRVRPAAER
jgi:ABC-type nitrate/sulfonate/bicarbonate transport system substrate-binding protein